MPCSNPLEPIEIQALAAGEEPEGRPDALAHASACASCAEELSGARRLAAALEDAFPEDGAPDDIADRVLRVRPFSASERWSFRVWRAPLGLFAGLTAAGSVLIAGSPAGPAEQLGVFAAAAGSLAALVRASARAFTEIASAVPSGLAALSDGLRPTAAGWIALGLFVPAAFGLRRILVRAFVRR